MVFSEMIGVRTDIKRHDLFFAHVALQLGGPCLAGLGVLVAPFWAKAFAYTCDLNSKLSMGLRAFNSCPIMESYLFYCQIPKFVLLLPGVQPCVCCGRADRKEAVPAPLSSPL